MGPIQTLDELLNLLWRRRWQILIVTLVGMALSVAFGLSRPKTYTSAAVIQVESPLVSDGDTQSARVLQVLEQRLTTRENLTRMIERHGLFADAPGLSMDQKINVLRGSVGFQSVPASSQPAFGQPEGISALIITASFGEADQAARVANDFAQSVLDLSAARQSSRAQETVQFYLTEESRVAGELAATESELADFRRANPSALPGEAEARRDRITSLEVDLRRLDQSAAALAAERAALGARERLRETDRRRLDDIAAELAVLETQSSALRAQIETLQAAGQSTPEVDRAIAGFDRRIDMLQGQLDLIAARRAEAETALRLERDRQAEHFTLLERATIPEYPTSGSRRKIAVLGSVVSLVMAFCIAFGLDVMHPVLRSSSQLERALGIRPVVAIPEINPPRQRGALRRWLLGYPAKPRTS